MRINKGFTLIEILVVVLIIGILGAIALPQYQRAVLKSRFAALMPIAKSMADSNEAFYLEHGEYADNAEDLPVQGRRNYTDGTELEFGTLTGYSYVLATRDNDFPNNYVVYQKHSENYPGEIHCEADANNTQAQEVCKSFGPTQELGETLTSGYLTYVLFGTGNGVAPSGDNSGNDNPGDNPDTTESEPEPEEPRPAVTSVECESVACNYEYETGSYFTGYPTRKYTFSCDPDKGGCSDVYQDEKSGGGRIMDNLLQQTIQYNADGSLEYANLEGDKTSIGLVSGYFDGNGNYLGGRAANAGGNAGGLPSGAREVYYDASGNVRRVQFTYQGPWYYYDAEGHALSSSAPVQDVSGYNILSTEEYAGLQSRANKIKTKTKCQLYPELQECATNTSN